MKHRKQIRYIQFVLILVVLSLAIHTPVFAHPHNVEEGKSYNQSNPLLPPEADDKGKTPLDIRLKQEEASFKNPFSLTPHKQNYLLPFTYNTSPNNEPFDDAGKQFTNTEMKFQLSFKYRVVENILKSGGDVFFGYTHQSYWQAYDAENSSPFRETNYEPELMLRFINNSNENSSGLRNRINTIGFVHQSNGQAGSISRSWNRVYARFVFEKTNFLNLGTAYLDIKPWIRIPEDDETDDNPSMEKYFGYGEVTGTLHTNSLRIGLMLRNNLRSQNRGAIQVDCSFPIRWVTEPMVWITKPVVWVIKQPLIYFFPSLGEEDKELKTDTTQKKEKLRGYVQFFNGYGESLVDYNYSVNRFGIGVILIDWL